MYTVAYPSSYSSVTRVTVAGTRVTGRSWPRPLDVKGDWLVSPVGNHESPEDAGQMAMGRKHQVPKPLSATRPWEDLVSRAQSGETIEQGIDAKSTCPLGPELQRLAKEDDDATWPMLRKPASFGIA